MTRWRSLYAAVCRRAPGVPPSVEARGVLQLVLYRLSRGDEVPGRAALAAEVGRGEPWLRARLEELAATGLLYVHTPSGGSAASTYTAGPMLEPWSRGAEIDTPGVRNSTPQGIENQHPTRARGNSSYLSLSASSTYLADEAKRTLNRAGVPTPLAIRYRIDLWLQHGATLNDFAVAAERCALRSVKAFDYLEVVLADVTGVPVARVHGSENVVQIDDYRGEEPNHEGDAS